jgi:hypothetical protein
LEVCGIGEPECCGTGIGSLGTVLKMVFWAGFIEDGEKGFL